jgi:hypothetical protein
MDYRSLRIIPINSSPPGYSIALNAFINDAGNRQNLVVTGKFILNVILDAMNI